jgi:hypothetical protein
MDDLPIETIASVNLAGPIALSILWERGPSRERSLATVAPNLRITGYPSITTCALSEMLVAVSQGYSPDVWLV